MKRAKYKAKNINEYKRLRSCTCQVHHCDEPGIIIYRIDTEHGFRYEHRCIEHVHIEKPTTVIDEAKKPQANLYQPMPDHRPWMDIGLYQAGKGR